MVNIIKFQTESCCDRLYITWDICRYGYRTYYKYYKGYQYTPVKLQMKKQTVNLFPSDHNILISWPDWSQPQVFNDFRKKFSFIFTYFLTSPPMIFHTTYFHFPSIFAYFLTPSPRMYSDGSVTKKGWSINWRAIPDWSSPIITISTLWPPKLAPILTADRRVPQWICFNQSANKYSMKIYHRLRFIFQFWTIHQLNSFFFGDQSVYVLNCPWMLIVREVDVLFFVFFLE